MSVLELIEGIPREVAVKHTALIIETGIELGWLKSILPLRHFGEPLPDWNLNDFKYFYLDTQKRREQIRKSINSLRVKYKMLEGILNDAA